ncbi:MAG TPA: 50S ribosomal protein L9 [Candidatus Paceibacterota bacterium]|nr:50S ribosomal protein L9 [Candidatus Paceibacterota bacterium]
MKVILLDNIRSVGQVGDVKDVSDGYARNFLIPRRLARAASEGAAKDVQAIKAKKLAAAKLADDEAKATAEKLSGTPVQIAGKANAKGTLFAAIEPADVAAELSGLAGARIEASAVQLDEPLKTVGEHEVTVKLTDNVSATVKVVIAAESK